MVKITYTLVLGALLVLSACSSSRGPVDPDAGNEGPDARVEINMADYEDFDSSAYEEEPPVPSVTIAHDVPAELLEGKVEEQVGATRQGFRIQLFSSQDKRAADRLVEDVIAWWRNETRYGTLADVYPGNPSPPPVYLDFRQPYYRIRVGDFSSRSEAQAVLRLMETRFAGAFIAPDTVTLRQ